MESTFQKNRSALGLAHAKIFMVLPKVDSPFWFLPKLILKSGSTLVVLDDDQSIHQIWKERVDGTL